MIQPAFHRERIERYGADMVSLTQSRTDTWSSGEVREIDQDMLQIALDIVTHCLLKTEIQEDRQELATTVNAAREEINAIWNSLQLFLPGWVPTPANIRLRRAIGMLDRIVYRIIDDRRPSAAGGQDLLSELLNAHDQEGNGMTNQQVRDETLTIFLAGHETSAVTLSWIFYLLGRHPEINELLEKELDEVLGDRPPTVEDLSALKYTAMIVNEALRLYPPATLIGRTALKDCLIGDYAVPAGTTVLASPWVLHRDGRYFEAPDTFKPTRWSVEFENRLLHGAYFPFGVGPRTCIGYRFALMELILILATVVQKYRLLPVSNKVIEPKVAVTLHPDTAVVMRVEKRY